MLCAPFCVGNFLRKCCLNAVEVYDIHACTIDKVNMKMDKIANFDGCGGVKERSLN